MPLLNKLSGAFPATLIYITVGSLIEIWSITAYLFFPPENDDGAFWTVGFMLTGLCLVTIGLLLGRIGRAARQAELPPEEITPAVAQVEKNAAKAQKPPPPEEEKGAPPPKEEKQPPAPKPATAPPPDAKQSPPPTPPVAPQPAAVYVTPVPPMPSAQPQPPHSGAKKK